MGFLINDLTSFLINDFTSYFDQRFDDFSINDFAKFLSSTTVGTVQVCVLKNCLEFIFSRSCSKFLNNNDLTSFLHQRFDEIFDQRFHEFLTSVCTVQLLPFRFW